MATKNQINDNGHPVDVLKPESNNTDSMPHTGFKSWADVAGTQTIMSIQNIDKIPDIDKVVVHMQPAKDNIDLFAKASNILSEAYSNSTGNVGFAYIGEAGRGNGQLMQLGLFGQPGFSSNLSPDSFVFRNTAYTATEREIAKKLGENLKAVGDAGGKAVDYLDGAEIVKDIYSAVQTNNAGDVKKSNEHAAQAVGNTVKFGSNKAMEVVGFAACAFAAKSGAGTGAGIGAGAAGVGAVPGAAIGGLVGYSVCGLIVIYSADKGAEGLGKAAQETAKGVLDNTRELQVIDIKTRQPVTVIVGNRSPAKAVKLGNATTGKRKVIKLLHNPNKGITAVKPIYNNEQKKPNSFGGNKPVDM